MLVGPQWEGLNRWLLELTSILTAQGEIDPDAVQGLPTVYNQVGDNSVDIQTLFGIASAQSAAINNLSAIVTDLQTRVTALEARSQVFNGTGAPAAGLGNVGDWYANIGPPVGGVGARIYVKTAAATWSAFPF